MRSSEPERVSDRYSALTGTLLPFTVWSLACWVLFFWHIGHVSSLAGAGVEGSPQPWFLLAGGAPDVTDPAIKLRIVVWNLLFLAGVAWLPLAVARNAAAPFIALIGLGGALLIEPAMRSAHYLGLTREDASIWSFDAGDAGFSFFHTLLIVEIAVAFIATMAIYRMLFRSRRARAVFFQTTKA